MNYVNRKDNGKYISGTKPVIKKNQVRVFESFNDAHTFCIDNGIDTNNIHAKYKTFKVET